MMNDSGKQNTSKEYTTDRSYGDPLKSDVPPMNYTDKAANSIIAESTERASTKKRMRRKTPLVSLHTETQWVLLANL